MGVWLGKSAIVSLLMSALGASRQRCNVDVVDLAPLL